MTTEGLVDQEINKTKFRKRRNAMFKETEKTFLYETEVTRKGAYVKYPHDNPEAMPIFLTTAFNVEDVDDLFNRYEAGGFTYNRVKNPNRSALAEVMTYIEGGEDTVACSSGMGAITTLFLSNLQTGDHVVFNKSLYGEIFDLHTLLLDKMQIEVSYVDFNDLDAVRQAMKPNTKMVYTESATNPMLSVPDIAALAEIAHSHNALMVVDNTFMTAYAVRPIDYGADLVVNSLTKFANGHSDAVSGSLTGRADLIKKAQTLNVLLGAHADSFSSWLTTRGLRTFALRLDRQMENAAAVAKVLDEHPNVLKVNHPSLESHPQHELAKKQFNGKYGGMLSFEPKNASIEKINQFMRELKIIHYAMTLGGYRTTMTHPVSSSHRLVPEEKRLAMGLTNGLIRLSFGIENKEDLIEDLTQALRVFDD